MRPSTPGSDLPDPYYGGLGFEEVPQMVEHATDGLVEQSSRGESLR